METKLKDLEIEGFSVCAACGKKVYTAFYNLSEWAYKRNHRFFCSYSCMQSGKMIHRKKDLLKK